MVINGIEMKRLFLIASVCLLCGVCVFLSCARITPAEITEISLKRCLTPSGESVEVENDVEAVIKWAVLKDADYYTLEVARDETFSNIVENRKVAPGEVPVRITLPGPGNYYYRIKASSSKRDDSHWSEPHKIKIK